MDAYSRQADLLKALAHPTRLAVVEILREGEQCVCHMGAMLGIRQSTISQQLMTLREAGLVEVRRDGNNVYYHVVERGLFDVLNALYAATGKPEPPFAHNHSKAQCPCPKCSPVQHVPLDQVSVRS